MGLLADTGINVPKINIGGFLSSTWFYVVLICIVGVILIFAVLLLLFFVTYKKKIIIFENISGQGYLPVFRSRARILRLKASGGELMKTLFGGHLVSASGRKMGKNTYWFAKGTDGGLYNIVVGDLDTKNAMLDIEPIDRDVRMFQVALDRISQTDYGKQSFMEKYGFHMLAFFFLLILIVGMWFITGKIGDAVAPLGQSAETSLKVQEMNVQITNKLDSIAKRLGLESDEINIEEGSGIIPAT